MRIFQQLQLVECVVFTQLSGLLFLSFPRTLYFINNGYNLCLIMFLKMMIVI